MYGWPYISHVFLMHGKGLTSQSHTNKGKGKKCVSFLPSILVHPWSVMWTVWMLSSCLVACAMMYQPDPCTQSWIWRGVNTCMDGWSSWYITHHQMQRLKVCLFLVHPLGIVWLVCIWSSCFVAYVMVDQHNPTTHYRIESGVNTCMDVWSSWYIIHYPRQVGQDFVASTNQPAISREVRNVKRSTNGHGWVAIYFTCLVETLEISNMSGMELTHRKALHPPPERWVKYLQGLQIMKPFSARCGVGYDVRISGCGCVDMHCICPLSAWERSDNPEIQFIHRDALHPDQRPPNMWAQVW